MSSTTPSHQSDVPTPPELIAQFNTSSLHKSPPGYKTWRIKNDYPPPKPQPEAAVGDVPGLPLPDVPVYAPWTDIDFKTDSVRYAKLIKEYCWEGNVKIKPEFDVHQNTTRPWYHAPWMHQSSNGREPINGLTYERPTPPWELSINQQKGLQNWAIGFYNSPGASVFGKVWANPAAPVWDDHLKFPEGTVVFKLQFTTATDEEVPTMVGSPEWDAVISLQKDTGPAPPTAEKRKTTASTVRLIQFDWAVVDPHSPIGWVFGTYIYDGARNDPDPWDRLTPIGLMWGNDPQLTNEMADAGERPKESWVNPEADFLLKEILKGKRGSWGWKGRLSGPADNFVSACTSCHGAAQSSIPAVAQFGHFDTQTNTFIPLNEKLSMTWFENVKAGEPFSHRGAFSADYSMQFAIGWENYTKWVMLRKAQDAEPDPNHKVLFAMPGKRVVFRPDADDDGGVGVARSIHVEEESLRTGPTFVYNPNV